MTATLERAKEIVAEAWRQTCEGPGEFDDYAIPLIAESLSPAQAKAGEPIGALDRNELAELALFFEATAKLSGTDASKYRRAAELIRTGAERAAELEWNKPYPHSKAGEGRIPEDIARAINELNDYADDLDATERPAIGDYDVAADIRAICQFAVDLAVPASVQEQPVAWRPWFVSDLHSGDRCEGDSFNNRIIARAESPADALKIVEAHNRPAAWQDGYRAGLKRAAKYHDDAARDCEAIAAVNKDNDLGPDCETHAIDHRVAADDLRELALATPSQTAGEREWQPIETAPETAWGCRNSGLVYSSILGVKSAELGNYNGYVHASIAGYHGNAVEDWGVTHWMPLPSSPTGEKQ